MKLSRRLTLSAASAALSLSTVGLALAAPAEKVEVCHYPADQAENPHTITVSGNAVDAHLAHGDTLGVCAGDRNHGDDDNGTTTPLEGRSQ